MLDPRIYRTGLAAVLLAAIVFAFSLETQQSGRSTNLAPDAFNGGSVFRTIKSLAGQYPQRRPGATGDNDLAQLVARSLSGHGFSVSTDTFDASTVDGTRTLQTVIGQRAGQTNGTIVVVSHRDAAGSPATADLSGTAVMLELGRILQGESLEHSVELVSVSGSAGSAGTSHLAQQLAGQPVDAVIDLGDLAAAHPTQPVVVPWGSNGTVAPPALRNTLATALRSAAGASAGGNSVGAQLARLAFPMTISDQGPFASHGIAAVQLSTSGERGPAANEPISVARVTAFGSAALVAVNALDGGAPIPAPTAYLLINGKVVPLWAVRLLVLALILPVLVTTIDGTARARRHGHMIGGWILWVLSAAVPFALAAVLARGVKLAGLLKTAPPGPLGAGDVPLHSGGVALLAGIGVLVVLGFWLIRPLCLRLAALAIGERRFGPVDEGTGAALLLVICVIALVIWLANPFAALLLVPALHLWMWVVDPAIRLRRWLGALFLLIGILPPALVAVYYAHALHFGAVNLLWNGTLLISGGSLGLVAALQWSVVLGCTASVAVIVVRLDRHKDQEAAVVTVRGPITYAGPGSLGGTESALRR
jgi:Peptidase family M28